MDYKRYLGDGVYVEWDGAYFILRANDSQYPNATICLDRNILAALNRFETDVLYERALNKSNNELFVERGLS